MPNKIDYRTLETEFSNFLVERFNAKVNEDALDITFNDLKLDSLDFLDIIVWAEEKYDITLLENNTSKLNTAREFVDLVYNTINKEN